MPAIESKHENTGVHPVNIAYIGNKEVKNDTLCRTGVTWYGRFDVQAVDAVPASRLLRHPTVFIRAEKLDEYKTSIEESIMAGDDDQDKSSEPESAPSMSDVGVSAVDDQVADPAEAEAKAKVIEEIKTVILSLDSENENHFTTKGKPKVEAVRSRMPDVEVSADDVAEAYKGLEVG